VNCLPDAGAAGLGGNTWPQRLDDFVAAQPASRRKAEELDEVAGAALPPRVAWHRLPVDLGAKITEKTEIQARAHWL
jgi:hypothetical protein